MRRRSAAAVAALAVAAALVPTVAAAHEEGWAGSGWKTAPDQVFGEHPNLEFTFVHDGPPTQPGIERVRFSYARADGSPETIAACAPPDPPEFVVAEPDDAETVTAVHQAVLPCNGRYTVTAVATTADGGALHDPEPSPPMVLSFATAVPAPPPTGLAVEAGRVDGDTAAELRWAPPEPAPPDMVGYFIERSRRADGDFKLIAESVQPTFVDGEAAEGGVFHYRVRAMRLGPGDDLVASAATEPAAVDIPPPPTTSTTTTAPADEPAVTGAGSLQAQANLIRPGTPVLTPGGGTVTTIDTGFQETLPFDPSNPNAATTTPTGATDGGLAAESVQLFDDGDGSDRKAVLAPVAGALALLVVFLQLRWLLRQASP